MRGASLGPGPAGSTAMPKTPAPRTGADGPASFDRHPDGSYNRRGPGTSAEEAARGGPARVEDFDPAKEEIAAHFKKIDDRLNNLLNQVNAAVQKVQAAGLQGPELDDTKAKIQQAVQSYRSEPNKTYTSSLDRITELMENL